MKCLFLFDKKITADQRERLEADFSNLIYEHTDIDPDIYTEDRDFSYYPTFLDSDGDKRPTDKWLRETIGEVYKKYKEDIDHVFIQVHEDNWQSGRIWGTAFGNIYNGYQVLYCRFDKDNPANSLGTTYHEWMHTLDVFTKTYAGVDIEQLLSLNDWDTDIVHGQHPQAKYIRYKDNTEWLEMIAPYLTKAYAKRRELYFVKVKQPLMQQIITLSEQVIVLLRQAIYKKDGVGR